MVANSVLPQTNELARQPEEVTPNLALTGRPNGKRRAAVWASGQRGRSASLG